jgi:hypothetical protein
MEVFVTGQAAALTRHDLEAKIVKHCWEDAEFRKEFTADPGGVLVKYLQVPAASVPKIVVHEETTGFWHIVLPAKPANTGELSEEDLENVAGGTTPTVTVLATIVVSVTAASASVAMSLDQGW